LSNKSLTLYYLDMSNSIISFIRFWWWNIFLEQLVLIKMCWGSSFLLFLVITILLDKIVSTFRRLILNLFFQRRKDLIILVHIHHFLSCHIWKLQRQRTLTLNWLLILQRFFTEKTNLEIFKINISIWEEISPDVV